MEGSSSPSPTHPSSSIWTKPWFWPLIVLLLAFLIRIPGIGWGLKNDLHNQSYHPDEFVTWNYSQQIEPTKFDFDPGFYNYPTLYLTILRVASDMVRVYSAQPDTEEGFWTYVSLCHLAGRYVSALAGAGTALLVFLVVRRRAGLFGAFFGASAVAISPGHLVHSRFQSVDVLAAFFVALALWSVDRFDGTERPWRRLLWSAVFVGLAAGTKYTGFLALAAVWVGIWAFFPKQDWLRAAASSLGVTVGTFLVTTPGVFVNPSKFWQDFAFELNHSASGHGLVFVDYPSGFVTHLMNLTVGMGPLLFALSLTAVVLVAWRRQRWFWPVLVFFALHYIAIGRAEVLFFRYTLPLFVPLAIALGTLVSLKHAGTIWQKGWVAAAILAIGGVDGGGLAAGARMTSWMATEDPRDAAARFIKKEFAGPESSVGLATDPWFYTPPLYPDVGLGPGFPFGTRMEKMAEATQPKVVRFVPANPDERKDWDLRLIEELRPDAVVVSSFEAYDPIRLKQKEATEFIKALDKNYPERRLFGGPASRVHDLAYIRPEVVLWSKKKN